MICVLCIFTNAASEQLTRACVYMPLQMAPRLTPRPADDALFLQGMLEGIAAIEARSYALLRSMGASPLSKVHNLGPGIIYRVVALSDGC